MKLLIRYSYILIGLLIFNSCAYHNGFIHDSVSLGQANFRYTQFGISGSSSTTHILGLGGLDRMAIVQEAKREMLKNVQLKPNQALANTTINWKDGFYILFQKRTCTVTADIVEFYEEDSKELIVPSSMTGKNSDVMPENNVSEQNNTKTENEIGDDLSIDYEGVKVGDKVHYKDAYRDVTGVITKIQELKHTDTKTYYIKYTNNKGVEKTLKAKEGWFEKIE